MVTEAASTVGTPTAEDLARLLHVHAKPLLWRAIEHAKPAATAAASAAASVVGTAAAVAAAASSDSASRRSTAARRRQKIQALVQPFAADPGDRRWLQRFILRYGQSTPMCRLVLGGFIENTQALALFDPAGTVGPHESDPPHDPPFTGSFEPGACVRVRMQVPSKSPAAPGPSLTQHILVFRVTKCEPGVLSVQDLLPCQTDCTDAGRLARSHARTKDGYGWALLTATLTQCIDDPEQPAMVVTVRARLSGSRDMSRRPRNAPIGPKDLLWTVSDRLVAAIGPVHPLEHPDLVPSLRLRATRLALVELVVGCRQVPLCAPLIDLCIGLLTTGRPDEHGPWPVTPHRSEMISHRDWTRTRRPRRR